MAQQDSETQSISEKQSLIEKYLPDRQIGPNDTIVDINDDRTQREVLKETCKECLSSPPNYYIEAATAEKGLSVLLDLVGVPRMENTDSGILVVVCDGLKGGFKEIADFAAKHHIPFLLLTANSEYRWDLLEIRKQHGNTPLLAFIEKPYDIENPTDPKHLGLFSGSMTIRDFFLKNNLS